MPADVYSFPGTEDPSNTGTQSIVNAGFWQGVFSDVSGFGALDVVVDLGASTGAIEVIFGASENGTDFNLTQTLAGTYNGVPVAFSFPAVSLFALMRVHNLTGGTLNITVTTILRPVRPPQVLAPPGFVESAPVLPVPAGFYVAGHVSGATDPGIFALSRVALDPATVGYSVVGAKEPPAVDAGGASYVHQRSGLIEGRTTKQALLDADVTNGPKVIVAAVAGKIIRVVGYMISESGAGAGTYKFTDGSGGTVINPGIALGATSTVNEHASTGNYLFQTSAGNALAVSSNVATARSIRVNYIEV